jgi:predicted DNA-binding protein (MmcQ/YjbR family)
MARGPLARQGQEPRERRKIPARPERPRARSSTAPAGAAPPAALARLRTICLALPEAIEQETWEIPTFRVRTKIFVMYTADEDRPSIWMKAPPGSQTILVGADADRFFVPPYVGHKGWVGMHLDARPDWREVRTLVERSYRMTAPKRLAQRVPAKEEGFNAEGEQRSLRKKARAQRVKRSPASSAHPPRPRR